MSNVKTFDFKTVNNIVIININFDPTIDADLNILSEVKQLKEFINKTSPKGILFDFSQSGYFGSSMLEAILEIWNLIKGTNCKMILCELSEIGLEIIELSRLDTLWIIKPTRKEAIEAF